MNRNKKNVFPIKLIQVYVRYYIPLILGTILRNLNLIPDIKAVQVLLTISVLYAVIGSYKFLILNNKYQKSTYNPPNTEDYELTRLAKKLVDFYEAEKLNPSIINEYLIKIFIRYQMSEIKSDDPLHDKFLAVSGDEYVFSMKNVQKLLNGEYETDFNRKEKSFKLDFNFKTIVPYMEKFITLYRDMLNNGYVNDNNEGVICFRNFIIIWLIEHCYLTDALLEDEEIYIRKEA